MREFNQKELRELCAEARQRIWRKQPNTTLVIHGLELKKTAQKENLAKKYTFKKQNANKLEIVNVVKNNSTVRHSNFHFFLDNIFYGGDSCVF